MWIPFRTLFWKEVHRFWRVGLHTILAPVLTGFLYLVVFGEALSKHLPVYEGVSYTAFIVPGLIMMSVLQNAFANTASSLIQAKIAGHLVFVLMPAIPGPQMAAAYIGASFVRSFLVGAGLYIVCAWWAMPPVREPFLLIAFAFFGAAIMASLGLITALWAEKYDQMGAVQSLQSLLLSRRRLPTGLFRARRHGSLGEPRGDGPDGLGHHDSGGDASHPRVENPSLRPKID